MDTACEMDTQMVILKRETKDEHNSFSSETSSRHTHDVESTDQAMFWLANFRRNNDACFLLRSLLFVSRIILKLMQYPPKYNSVTDVDELHIKTTGRNVSSSRYILFCIDKLVLFIK